MAFDFEKVGQKFQQFKRNIPKQIANDAQNFYVKNFDKQQWEGKSWEPRKDKKNKRKLLVRRGALRRAVSNVKREATFEKIRFEVFVQSTTGYNYAQIQNEGGTIFKKESKRTVGFRMKNGNLVFAKKGKATFEQDVKIGRHRIIIPRRRFLGRNKELDVIIRKKVDQEVKKLFK